MGERSLGAILYGGRQYSRFVNRAVMAYFHQRRRIGTRLPVRRVSLIATLYYAENFPPVQIRIRIPVWRFSLMATVPILGRRPRDPNPNPSPLVEMSH